MLRNILFIFYMKSYCLLAATSRIQVVERNGVAMGLVTIYIRLVLTVLICGPAVGEHKL